MLTSLFGDLGPRDGRTSRAISTTPSPIRKAGSPPPRSWKAWPPRSTSAARSSTATSATWSSPARRRRRSASTSPPPGADLETATSMITLLDPVGVWASAVIKALSDAGGRPIERLHLREKTTLQHDRDDRAHDARSAASEDTLRIFHADVRAPGPRERRDPGRADGAQPDDGRDHRPDAAACDRRACSRSLRQATSLPTWRCPQPAVPCCRRTPSGSPTRSARWSGRSGCTCTSSASR